MLPEERKSREFAFSPEPYYKNWRFAQWKMQMAIKLMEASGVICPVCKCNLIVWQDMNLGPHIHGDIEYYVEGE